METLPQSSEAHSFETFHQQKFIPNLDGLRGLAIFLVLIHHLPTLANPYLSNLQPNGRLGVMLFFVISGFLITSLGCKERRESGRFSFWNFYMRRSLRIFPLYYAVLGLVCFLIYVLHVYPPKVQEEFTAKLPSYLFYYSNLTGPIQGPYSLVWSLAVEEQFYLFFALIFFFLPPRASRNVLLSLCLLRIFMPLWSPFIDGENLFIVAFRYQEAILLGVALAFLLENRKIFAWFSRVLGNLYATAALGACLIVGFFTLPLEQYPSLETATNLIFFLIISSVAIQKQIYFIGGPLLSYIGKISYGIYLLHTIVFYGVRKFISVDPLLIFLLGGALTLCMAALSYRYFESYFLRLKPKSQSFVK